MKLVIMSGASRGLGLSIAQNLLLNNFRVIGMSRHSNPELAKNTLYEHWFTDLDLLENLESETRERLSKKEWGSVSEIHIVHNASIFKPVGLVSRLKREEIESGLRVNLISTVVLSQIFLEFFEKKKIPLRILFVSSPAANIGIPGASVYAVAKAGIESLVKTIHSELSFYQNEVKCMSFMPGRINTEMQAEMRSYSKEVFPAVERYQGFHERGELLEPDLVAKIFCENFIEKDFESGRSYSVQEFFLSGQ